MPNSIIKKIFKIFKAKGRESSADIKQEQIGSSYIVWNRNQKLIIKAYYNFCISEINCYLKKIKIEKNIIFGDFNHKFPNKNSISKIDIQYEHTIVKPGGRDSENAKISKTPLSKNQKYLVRIAEEERIKTIDIVIDYSWPNYIHVKKSGQFNWLLNKYFVISPMLYDYKKITCNANKRSFETITLFTYPKKGRRAIFLETLKKRNIKVKNVRECFEKVEEIYYKTKILVNIHQTNEHQTLEELRVLPALLCGTIVISEYSPLTNYCGYEEFIIWGNIDEIPTLIIKVQKNYDEYWNKIFNSVAFYKKMEKINNRNKKNIINIIENLT